MFKAAFISRQCFHTPNSSYALVQNHCQLQNSNIYLVFSQCYSIRPYHNISSTSSWSNFVWFWLLFSIFSKSVSWNFLPSYFSLFASMQSPSFPPICEFWTLFLFLRPPSSSSFPLPTSSTEEGVRSSGTCGGVVLSCTDKLNRRTVLVRPVSKQDTFSHFSGFFPPVRIQLLSFSLDSASINSGTKQL